MRALKNLGFEPSAILDVGAYHGSWSEVMWHVWPNAQYHLIEANEDCRPQLARTGFEYDIALLSDSVRDVIYHKCQTGSGEGNSIYLEASIYPFVPTLARTQTLDSLLPKDAIYDLIKVDAQGSDLDVIKGGLSIVSRAHIVQLECQIQQYNQSAPLALEVLNYMDSIGFRLYDIGEFHHTSRNMLNQADFIFARKDSPLFGLKNLT